MSLVGRLPAGKHLQHLVLLLDQQVVHRGQVLKTLSTIFVKHLSIYKNISSDNQNSFAPPAAPRSPAPAAGRAGCWWLRAQGRGTASYLDYSHYIYISTHSLSTNLHISRITPCIHSPDSSDNINIHKLCLHNVYLRHCRAVRGMPPSWWMQRWSSEKDVKY